MYVREPKNEKHPFVQADKSFINDSLLSFKAKGVFLYLLSKPDDWVVSIADIMNHATDGKASVKSAIKELSLRGYLQRTRLKNNSGKFIGYDYIVHETIPTTYILPTQAQNALVKKNKYRNIRCDSGETAHSYEEYLQTKHWLLLREAIYVKRNKQCEICHKELKTYHVHHKYYTRIGFERESDLMLLCPKCHENIHKERKRVNSDFVPITHPKQTGETKTLDKEKRDYDKKDHWKRIPKDLSV